MGMPPAPVGVVAVVFIEPEPVPEPERVSPMEDGGFKACRMDEGPGEAVTVIAGMSDLVLPLVGVPARLPPDSAATRGEGPRPMVADIGSMLKFKCGCGRTAIAIGSEALRLSECHP